MLGLVRAPTVFLVLDHHMTDDSDRRPNRHAKEFARARLAAHSRAFRKRNRLKLNAKQRLRRATDPDFRERCKRSERAYALKRLYGITIEEYDALFTKPKGRCAICKQKPKGQRLSVDHCHRGKFVRWLLCNLCNRGLGCFRDDPRLLRTAAAGLSRLRKPKPRLPTKPARKKRR
jgi:recombination endonuclease VII